MNNEDDFDWYAPADKFRTMSWKDVLNEINSRFPTWLYKGTKVFNPIKGVAGIIVDHKLIRHDTIWEVQYYELKCLETGCIYYEYPENVVELI